MTGRQLIYRLPNKFNNLLQARNEDAWVRLWMILFIYIQIFGKKAASN